MTPTLKQLRSSRLLNDSDFQRAYFRLLLGKRLGKKNLRYLLTVAIILMQSPEDAVYRLGYRIILQYSKRSNDYEPLLTVALANDLAPITAHLSSTVRDSDSFDILLQAAYHSNFNVEIDGKQSHRTRGQLKLREAAKTVGRGIFVAPTSYGKSELMLDQLFTNIDGFSVVLVPSKALIHQTRSRIIADARISAARPRVITHPDSFNPDLPTIAVLTQERYFRLLRTHASVSPNVLIVDEAHGMLEDDRGELLAQTILSSQFRNAGIPVSYYTPFIANTSSLYFNDTLGSEPPTEHRVEEALKVEMYFYTRLEKERVYLYDQFLNRSVEASKTPRAHTEIDFIIANSDQKNLVYVNKPRDAESVALQLSDRSAELQLEDFEAAATAIAEITDEDYALVGCVRNGISFHHGKVPDNVRQYVEHLFRKRANDRAEYIVATSTLLEGVNTPAQKLFVLDAHRGPSHLTAPAFRNLAGRVARLNDVFSAGNDLGSALQPPIYVVDGETSAKNFNPERFLTRVANEGSVLEDVVSNPLLEEGFDEVGTLEAYIRYENVEPGATGRDDLPVATTNVGRLLFEHAVEDIDAINSEVDLQQAIDEFHESKPELIDTPSELIAFIAEIFLPRAILLERDPLRRLETHSEARDFYAMYLDWRCDAFPMRLMIASFLRRWSERPDEPVYVGTSWGDFPMGDGSFRNMYVDMRTKSRKQQVTLAVARIKEEDDFIDYKLSRYIEVTYSLGLMSEGLHNRLLYGTNDSYLLALIKSGFSPELARLIRDTYREYVRVSGEDGLIEVSRELAGVMAQNLENLVLTYEAASLTSV